MTLRPFGDNVAAEIKRSLEASRKVKAPAKEKNKMSTASDYMQRYIDLINHYKAERDQFAACLRELHAALGKHPLEHALTETGERTYEVWVRAGRLLAALDKEKT